MQTVDNPAQQVVEALVLEAVTTFETVSIHRRYVGRDSIGRGPAALKLSVLMVCDCAAGQPKVE